MPLTHITKCRLCPNQEFQLAESEFEKTELGAQTPMRVQEFSMKLLAHIQRGADFERKALEKAIKKFEKGEGPAPDAAKAPHLAAWNTFLALTACAQGWGIMCAFETMDPGLLAMREAARSGLQQMSRKFFFTDQMISDGTVQWMGQSPWAGDNELTVHIATFCKGIRDALCEVGDYAPGGKMAVEAEQERRIVLATQGT